jgi:hypothetical protein
MGRMGSLVFGWAESVGEIERPFKEWSGLARLLGERAEQLERDIQRNRGRLLLVQYSRGPLTGDVALRVQPRDPIHISAMEAADASETTLRLRSGLDAQLLASKRVAILGLGAVGSFLADLFARGGVGELRLRDGERLRPGNSIRHLCGPEYWGLDKAEAVRSYLANRMGMEGNRLSAEPYPISGPADAAELFTHVDLLVDATANGPITLMLSDVAREMGQPFISVCVQREGDLVRADRWPLRDGETHAEAVPPVSGGLELREAGCGDPVSPAPSAAAVEAACLAWRMTVDALTGRHLMPPSIVQVTGPRAEPPFHRYGILS